MPAPPILRHGMRKEGPVKVLPQGDTQDPAQAADDVHIAGEVGIELDAVEGDAHEGREPGVGGIVGKQGGHERRQGVGDHQLLEEAPEHPAQAPAELVKVEVVPPIELRTKLAVAADGALEDLREEADEEQELREAPLGLAPVPEHVQQIAHGLEGIEGNAQRDDPLHGIVHAPAEPARHGVRLGQQEVDILEGAQDAEIQHQCPHKNALAAVALPRLIGRLLLLGALGLVGLEPGALGVGVLLDQQSRPPDGGSSEQEEGQVEPAPQRIKGQAEGQQHPPPEAGRDQKIRQAESQRKEKKRNRQ